MSLTDNCGRPLLNLRISVTQRCNIHCVYCHREGEVKRANVSAERMTVEEIVRIAKIAVSLGIARIKLTGGEPLMRQDLPEIVSGVAALPGLKDLSITTNGLLLGGSMAKKLHDRGLRRLNISLPSLNEETYRALTGGELQDALTGVEAAVGAGFCPVKINMVILKNVNVQDVPEMMEFAAQTGTVLQLIELDPVNVSGAYYSAHHGSLDELEEMLRANAVTIEKRPLMHNRLIYHLPNVAVEVVHPIENTDFCMHCTRMRVTSDGKLKPCLMRNDNLTDILTLIRQGADDQQLKQLFSQANTLREPYNKSA
ncbi:MAG TPA: GTP 3',8-cyclase MoaA [Candidatus Limnocylindrales bacterium]|nr:GTP 3',8-cyclase MoaA [Candidatus Limnocylindrales bacterium]